MGAAKVSVPIEGLLQECRSRWDPHKTFLSMWTPGGDSEFDRVTFRQFESQAQAFGARLSAQGIVPGDTVLLVLKQSISLMTCFWGCVLVGAVPSILAFPNFKMNPHKYAQGLAGTTRNSAARLVVLDPDLPVQLRQRIHLDEGAVRLDLDPGWLHGRETCPEPSSLRPDHVCLVQHSAGTTGLQKGIALTHRQVLTQMAHLTGVLDLDREDCVVSWLPLYHDMGLISSFLLPLLTGLPLVVQSPDEWVTQPESFLRLITRFEGTRAWMPNFAFTFLSRSIPASRRAGLDLSSLRSLVNCSEPVTGDAMDLFYEAYSPYGLSAQALQTSYAMAENVFAVTHSGPDGPSQVRVSQDELTGQGRVRRVDHDHPGSVRLVSSGSCLEGTRLRIVREDGREPCLERVGEIWIQGDCLFGGYRSPSHSPARFESDWYRTGDVGFVLDEQLFVLGRLDDAILVGGRNIQPTEIEDLVGSHPRVRPGRSVALGVDNLKLGTQDLVVVAELRDPEDLDDATHLRQEIGASVTALLGFGPRFVHLVEPGWIVKSSAGKPARGATRSKLLAHERDLTRKFSWRDRNWRS